MEAHFAISKVTLNQVTNAFVAQLADITLATFSGRKLTIDVGFGKVFKPDSGQIVDARVMGPSMLS